MKIEWNKHKMKLKKNHMSALGHNTLRNKIMKYIAATIMTPRNTSDTILCKVWE